MKRIFSVVTFKKLNEDQNPAAITEVTYQVATRQGIIRVTCTSNEKRVSKF